MIPTVRYEPRDDIWLFGESRRTHDGADSIVIKQCDLVTATATDLVRALRKAREHDAEPESILIDLAPDHEYAPKNSAVDLISFVLLADGRLGVQFGLTTNEYFNEDAELKDAFTPLLEPLLQRCKADLVDLRADEHRSAGPYVHFVSLVIPTRSRTLKQIYDIADSVTALFEAAVAGHVTRETVADLVLGGRADLLIGLREGHWLDVKSCHYDLDKTAGKISLAQSVSRFANAEEGGIVVVGMDAKRVSGGGEIIKGIKPVSIDSATARRYRVTLEKYLFPFPEALTISAIETVVGEGLVVVSVPPQDEELKPFLVHGAIVDGRPEGAFISIVRRSGEDSIPITAHQIHSTLAAGRALLRRGQLPEGSCKSTDAVPVSLGVHE